MPKDFFFLTKILLSLSEKNLQFFDIGVSNINLEERIHNVGIARYEDIYRIVSRNTSKVALYDAECLIIGEFVHFVMHT